MELYREVLAHILAQGEMRVTFPELEGAAERLAEKACCRALEEIRAVLADGARTDADCFARIEEIVRVFERMGVSCGGRHDFG